MPTYRIDLEYEGTKYHGWQEQANARSVAGELRKALVAAGVELIELGGAGRTDAGVHALCQTAHVRARTPVEAARVQRVANEALPSDIHILAVRGVPDAFHARHGAISRSYLYQISRRRTALAKRRVFWVKRPLDARRMAAAAALLAGRHDFRLLCERPSEQPSTLVVVEQAEVTEAGALILVRLTASHFLWKMVRRVVGCLVRVGAGEMSAEQFGGLIDARRPPAAGEDPAQWTAPASGLFLESIRYEGDPPPGPLLPVDRVLSG